MGSGEIPAATISTCKHSIWKDISEDLFREHIVALEARTNAIATRPATFPSMLDDGGARDQANSLSLFDEQRLADDFAYIAAIGEGAQSVAAVCIEEHQSSNCLCIIFAAADAMDDQLKAGIKEVGIILRSCTTTRTTPENSLIDRLQAKIIELHTQKILGRLRSSKWQKPRYLSRTHKKLLWQDLEKTIHKVEHVYPGRKHQVRRAEILGPLKHLQSILQNFEDLTRELDISLREIVLSCYEFCRLKPIQEFAMELETNAQPRPQVSAALKTLRQVEKIGAYRRISDTLLHIAWTYPQIFRDIQFQYLQPYKAVPTSIGYERWAKRVHVHSEVQLTIHYDQRAGQHHPSEFLLPRTIGASKYLCYLCFLFLKHHGRFQPTNTHGRIYDQWTIPDLDTYSEADRVRYRDVIKAMDNDIVDLTKETTPREGKREAWRSEPMTSRQNLLGVNDKTQEL